MCITFNISTIFLHNPKRNPPFPLSYPHSTPSSSLPTAQLHPSFLTSFEEKRLHFLSKKCYFAIIWCKTVEKHVQMHPMGRNGAYPQFHFQNPPSNAIISPSYPPPCPPNLHALEHWLCKSQNRWRRQIPKEKIRR